MDDPYRVDLGCRQALLDFKPQKKYEGFIKLNFKNVCCFMSHVLVMLHASVLFTSLSRLILRSRILLHEIFVRKEEDLVNLSPTGLSLLLIETLWH